MNKYKQPLLFIYVETVWVWRHTADLSQANVRYIVQFLHKHDARVELI